jgi:hypothetical protein
MIYADKQITCHDCGMDFTFTAKEQEQFASKTLSAMPNKKKKGNV